MVQKGRPPEITFNEFADLIDSQADEQKLDEFIQKICEKDDQLEERRLSLYDLLDKSNVNEEEKKNFKVEFLKTIGNERIKISIKTN